MPLFNYKCSHCEHEQENIRRFDQENICDKCGELTTKLVATPAFTFTNGVGTDGGTTLRRPGHVVPGGWNR